MRIIHFFIIFSAIASLSEASANAHQSLGSQAESYIDTILPPIEIGRREIVASKLDPRIRIPKCDSGFLPSVSKLNPEDRYINVLMQCPTVKGWNVYVPVKIRHLVPTIVAAHTINKGEMIDSGDLRIAFKDIHLAKDGPQDDKSEFIGAKAKRRISLGQTVSSNKICLVCKGERVTIVVNTSGLELKTVGSALSNGVLGDSISVKNQASGRVVDGTIFAAGEVKINL